MITYEVRQQEVLETMAVLSSNGLEITVDVSIWYQPEYQDLPKLHKEKAKLSGQDSQAIYAFTPKCDRQIYTEEIYSTKRDAIQKRCLKKQPVYWTMNMFR